MPAQVTILDGGMGQQLEDMGAPFRQPEWSALALIEAPERVREVHDAFITAGAEVITTNAYALVPYHIGAARFEADGKSLAALSGQLAREAADAVDDRTVLVAGCLPPLFGSYRPDLFDAVRAPDLLAVLVDGQAPFVDLWLAETMSSVAEAEAVRAALRGDIRPLWVSYTLGDDHPDPADPRLRSRETVADAVRAAMSLDAAAVLFNCSQPEVMGEAVTIARRTVREAGADLHIGVYANTYPPMTEDIEANADPTVIRPGLGPSAYLAYARDWVARGATIVGGCCGIGPQHIALLAQTFR